MTVVVPLPYIRSNRKQKYKCQNQQKSFHLILFLLETGFSKLIFAKKLSFCNKLKFSIPTSLQIYGVNLFNNRINSLKYLRSTALDCKDIGIRKSVFVAKTLFLSSLKVEHKSIPMMYHLSYLYIKHGI